MGLDMYLTKEIFIGAKYQHRQVKAKVSISVEGKKVKINPKRISTITEEVGYWRKANAIHAWFVKNVQKGVDDCRRYYVSSEQLEELLQLCRQVKRKAKLQTGPVVNGWTAEKGGQMLPNVQIGKTVKNTKPAEELLPTQGGFFFGSTSYDEYYIQDIDRTIEIIKALKKETDFKESDFYYQSSW